MTHLRHKAFASIHRMPTGCFFQHFHGASASKNTHVLSIGENSRLTMSPPLVRRIGMKQILDAISPGACPYRLKNTSYRFQ